MDMRYDSGQNRFTTYDIHKDQPLALELRAKNYLKSPLKV